MQLVYSYNPSRLGNLPKLVRSYLIKKRCPAYDTKLHLMVSVILEIWAVWGTPLMSLLPGPLWSWVIVLGRIFSMSRMFENRFCCCCCCCFDGRYIFGDYFVLKQSLEKKELQDYWTLYFENVFFENVAISKELRHYLNWKTEIWNML